MAITYAGQLGTASSATTGTTLAVSLTPSPQPAVGDLVFVAGARDELASDPFTGDSFADTAGNTWTREALPGRAEPDTTPANSLGTIVFWSVITSAWSGTSTLTWTHPSVDARTMIVRHYRPAAGSVISLYGTVPRGDAFFAPDPLVAAYPQPGGDLAIGVIGFDSDLAGITTLAGDTDTNGGSWSALTTASSPGSGGAAITVATQHKLLTGAAISSWAVSHGALVKACQALFSFHEMPTAGVRLVGSGAPVYAGSIASQTPPLPPGVAADDLLVMVIAARPTDPAGTNDAVTITGWTRLAAPSRLAGTGLPAGVALDVQVWYKVAGGSETAPTVTVGTSYLGGGTRWHASIAAYRGVDSNPFAVAQVNSSGAATTTFTPTVVATTANGAAVLSVVASSDANAVTLAAAPQSFVEAFGGADYDPLGGSIVQCVGLAHRVAATPSTPTMPTWTATGATGWVGITAALREFSPNATVTPAAVASTSGVGATSTLPNMASLMVWLDASKLGLANGAAVTTWPNLAGPSAIAATVAGSPAPTMRTNALGAGGSVVRFSSSQGRLRWTTLPVAKDFTLLVVARATSTTSTGYMFSANLGTNKNTTYGWLSGLEDIGQAYNAAGSNAGVLTPNVSKPQSTSWKLYSVDAQASPYLPRLFLDGVLLSGGTPDGITRAHDWGGTFGINGWDAVSASGTMNCEVAEVLFYNVKLLDEDRQAVEGYLRNKWTGDIHPIAAVAAVSSVPAPTIIGNRTALPAAVASTSLVRPAVPLARYNVFPAPVASFSAAHDATAVVLNAEDIATASMIGAGSMSAEVVVPPGGARAEMVGTSMAVAMSPAKGRRPRAVVVDMHGTPLCELPDAKIGSITYNLNEAESWSVTLLQNDPAAAFLVVPFQEVQVWRGDQLLAWGPVVRWAYDQGTFVAYCRGAAWYLSRRFVGKANRFNWVNNGSFEDGLAGWSAVTNSVFNFYGWEGAQAQVPETESVTNPRVDLKRSMRARNFVAGADAWLDQAFLFTVDGAYSPDGDVFTLKGYVYLNQQIPDGQSAHENRGLYLERFSTTQLDPSPEIQAALPGAPLTLEHKFVPLDEDTPVGVWTRLEIELTTPPKAGEPEAINVRLYAPANIDVFWDAVSLTLVEKLAFYNVDQAQIIEGIVRHLQDAYYDKSNINITTHCPPTGIPRTRVYVHNEHPPGWRSIQEFAELDDGMDFRMIYTPTQRIFATSYPQAGVLKSAYALTQWEAGVDGNIATWSLSYDGEQAASSVIVLGSGNGSDREEGWAGNASGWANGVTMEEVYTAPDQTPIDSLGAMAAERLNVARSPYNLKVQLTPPNDSALPDPIGNVWPGDTVPVHIDRHVLAIDDVYRIISTTIDLETGSMSLDLNLRVPQ